jgi:hypothetical protein
LALKSGLLSAGIKILQTAVAGATGVIRIITGVINALKNPLDTIRNAAGRMGSAIKDGASAALKAVSDLPGRIKKAVGNLGGILKDAGSDLVRGLWQGIQSMGDWLRDKLIGFVKDKIPGPIAKALGIDSPSKVAAALGREVPAGLAVGIARGAPAVATQSAALASRTISALSNLTAPGPQIGAPAGGVGVAGIAGGGLAAAVGSTDLSGLTLHADIYIGNEYIETTAVRVYRRESRAEARKLAATPRTV